jgi:hypothetical protein
MEITHRTCTHMILPTVTYLVISIALLKSEEDAFTCYPHFSTMDRARRTDTLDPSVLLNSITHTIDAPAIIFFAVNDVSSLSRLISSLIYFQVSTMYFFLSSCMRWHRLLLGGITGRINISGSATRDPIGATIRVHCGHLGKSFWILDVVNHWQMGKLSCYSNDRRGLRAL